MKPATLLINPDGSGGNVEIMYDLALPRTIDRMGQKIIVKSMIFTELLDCTDLSVVTQNPKYYSGWFGYCAMFVQRIWFWETRPT
jgi:hypothetical protein